MLLEKTEEKKIKEILAELANSYGFVTNTKEYYDKEKSLYLDMLWKAKIGEERVPIVAFEIEKGTRGYNERLRKNIFNLALSKAPRGYIIFPYKRIQEKSLVDPKTGKWHRKNKMGVSDFKKAFDNYYRPFSPYIDIILADADTILKDKKLKAIYLDNRN